MLLCIARKIASLAAVPTPHGCELFLHTILTDVISTLFAEALKKFDPISGQPTESHLTELREVL